MDRKDQFSALKLGVLILPTRQKKSLESLQVSSSRTSPILVPDICHVASYFEKAKKQLKGMRGGYDVYCQSNPALNNGADSFSDGANAVLE